MGRPLHSQQSTAGVRARVVLGRMPPQQNMQRQSQRTAGTPLVACHPALPLRPSEASLRLPPTCDPAPKTLNRSSEKEGMTGEECRDRSAGGGFGVNPHELDQLRRPLPPAVHGLPLQDLPPRPLVHSIVDGHNCSSQKHTTFWSNCQQCRWSAGPKFAVGKHRSCSCTEEHQASWACRITAIRERRQNARV